MCDENREEDSWLDGHGEPRDDEEPHLPRGFTRAPRQLALTGEPSCTFGSFPHPCTSLRCPHLPTLCPFMTIYRANPRKSLPVFPRACHVARALALRGDLWRGSLGSLHTHGVDTQRCQAITLSPIHCPSRKCQGFLIK